MSHCAAAIFVGKESEFWISVCPIHLQPGHSGSRLTGSGITGGKRSAFSAAPSIWRRRIKSLFAGIYDLCFAKDFIPEIPT